MNLLLLEKIKYIWQSALKSVMSLCFVFLMAIPAYANEGNKEKSDESNTLKKEAIEKRAELRKVQSILKKEFIGWDEEIGRMMSAARILKLHPELVTRPIVIPMISFPGYGKTTLIQRFLELMKWESNFISKSIVEEQNALPTEPILSLSSVKDSKTEFQGAILLDEIQKLKDLENLVKRGATKDGKNIALEERIAAHDIWWNFLGNGTYIEKRKITVEASLAILKKWTSYHLGAVTKLKDNRKKISDLELEIASLAPDQVSKKNELKGTLETWKQNAANLEVGLAHYKNSTLDEIRPARSSNTDLFIDYRDLTEEQFFLEMLKDPKAMEAKIEGRTLNAREEIVKTFKRGIIFALANPEPLIAKILDEAGESKKNPDRMRAIAERVATKEDTDRWFHKKFGNVPGWDSRWQLADWHLKMPFSESQWREMVSSRLEQFSDVYHQAMKNLGIDSKINFDRSVHDAFYESGVDSVNGPRVLYTNAPQILGSFITELEDTLLLLEEGRLPKDLMVSYDAVEKKMKAKEVGKQDKPFTFEHAVSFPKNEETLAPQAAKEILARQANHMAGHAIAGMLMFGSVPKELARETKQSEVGIDLMWETPAIQSHENKLNEIVALLGGWAGEQMLSGSAFVSENSRLDVIQAEKILKEIMGDLRLRQRLLSFSEDKPLVSIQSVIPKDMERLPGYKNLKLTSGDVQLALKEIQDLVYEMLKQHKDFAETLSTYLQERKTISSDDLKQLISKHFVTITPQLERELKGNPPGLASRNTCERALSEIANGPYRQGFFRRFYKDIFVRDLKSISN